MVDFDQRALGNLEAQVHSLSLAVTLLSTRLDRNSTQLAAIEMTLSEARGGWRALIWIAGVAGTAGSIITWLAQAFMGKAGP